jgi:uncharacterized protein (TIRG00374 family)
VRRFFFQLTLSVAIGGFFIWIAVDQMVSDIQSRAEQVTVAYTVPVAVDDMMQEAASAAGGDGIWSVMVDAFKSLDWYFVVGYILIFLVIHVIRIVRWYLQLRPLGERDFTKVFRVGAVGLAAIIVMPLRLGEFVRPWLLARESKIDFPAALGTSVVERVVDGLCVSLMLFFCLTRPGIEVSPFVTRAAWVCFSVFLSVLIAVALFAWQRQLAEKLVHVTIGKFSDSLAHNITDLFEGFIDGIASLRQGGALVPYFSLTLAYWLLNGFSVWFWATAFGFELPLIAGYGLVAILIVGIMVPAGPGFFGNFQLFLGAGLSLYLPPSQIGAVGFAMAVGLNLIQFLVQVLLAVPFYFATGVDFREAIEASEEELDDIEEGHSHLREDRVG